VRWTIFKKDGIDGIAKLPFLWSSLMTIRSVNLPEALEAWLILGMLADYAL
jgi:hypothetical protein